ncbi:FAD-dependent monooxygenase [Thalassotalea profundi]|uniref:2-octaprenyl-6-methoxyphenol hydroxylase n=1 Tax=Thalassotalea profundi TaxID=2036687 RepID=A0ABQ3IJV9_9GAMM|nr:FAD-dependent monooxygenase [Thalassotalea profundi]GHE85872.1 2-octaprenyl-6-methoxyphenol hydroxylase [Thalassotalea profundi]
MQKFDILIVGGGMVGLTTALAIRKLTSLSVAIVDTTQLTPLSDTPETRVSAINIASQQLFANLGVWENITNQRLQAYQHMHVWDQAGNGHIDFSSDELNNNYQLEQLGWIIENNVIRQALWQKAEQDSGIEFFTQENLTSLSMGDSEVFASFTNHTPLIAKLVIGADGAHSWVRKQMQMNLTFSDYDHHAIVATVECSQGHNNTAWQVFLPTGPLALLPLFSENMCSIVWSTSPQEAQRLIKLSADDFAKELTAQSDAKLGNVTLKSERFTFPLTMRFAQDFVQNKVVLVGDAAHTIHPLAGQGVNLGLLDAASIAQTLAESNETDHCFTEKSLASYQRWRKAEASDMIAAMALIKKVFEPHHPIINTIRGMGMSALNQLSPVKSLLIKHALGLKTYQPKLTLKNKS